MVFSFLIATSSHFSNIVYNIVISIDDHSLEIITKIKKNINKILVLIITL
jgi:hypothetical protein